MGMGSSREAGSGGQPDDTPRKAGPVKLGTGLAGKIGGGSMWTLQNSPQLYHMGHHWEPKQVNSYPSSRQPTIGGCDVESQISLRGPGVSSCTSAQ